MPASPYTVRSSTNGRSCPAACAREATKPSPRAILQPEHAFAINHAHTCEYISRRIPKNFSRSVLRLKNHQPAYLAQRAQFDERFADGFANLRLDLLVVSRRFERSRERNS
jgi:hypothetical protein